MDYDNLSTILGTTKTTIHNKKDDEKFSPAVSEKIVALADLYEFGYYVFEDKLNFEKWIQNPNKALGSRKPLELLDTIFGIEEVKNIIGRIAAWRLFLSMFLYRISKRIYGRDKEGLAIKIIWGTVEQNWNHPASILQKAGLWPFLNMR